MKKRLCIINAVGLTPSLIPYAPSLASVGTVRPWNSPLPAVTCTSQATMLTGLAPNQHGIVGNGWYFRDTAEIRFWQQANSLIQGPKFYQDFETCKMFWWFNQNAPVKWSATPKPHYGCDGSKVFDILDRTDCQLQSSLGDFPFASFWGPKAGLASTEWIAKASAKVMREKRPQLTLVYLPHLDYDFQRFEHHDPLRVQELDACGKIVIDAAQEIDAQVVVVSEYGLVPVHRPVYLNRALREAGYLAVRPSPFGEQLLPGESDAFAVVDHQLAHVYVRQPHRIPEVRRVLEQCDGVDQVVVPGDLQLDHPRSGELVVLAKPDAWFCYYHWLEDRHAPDYARTIDIHRKPGYDPVELFMTSPWRAGFRLLQKKLGFRYRMDIIPLDASLIRGSHGLQPKPEEGPLIIGQAPPDSMVDFPQYVKSYLS